MTSVSSVSTSSTYGYSAPTTGVSAVASQKTDQAAVQKSLAALESALTSFGSNPSSPLTYNASGLLDSFQQATPNSTTATTSAERAQAAVLAAQVAVTNTLSSLLSTDDSSGSSDSSGSDILSLFTLPGTSNSVAGGTGTQTTLDTLLSVQNTIPTR